MPVEDVFTIHNRGTVVTGRIESGTVRVGKQVNVVRDGGVAFTTEVTGVEKFRKVLDTATAGDNVGLLLEGPEPRAAPARRRAPGLTGARARPGRTSGTSPVSTSSRSGTTAVPVPLRSTAARTEVAPG